MASSHQYVTEVTQSKSWFGFRHRQRLTLDILDEASAAARAQVPKQHVCCCAQAVEHACVGAGLRCHLC
jgi:hypothetical protein